MKQNTKQEEQEEQELINVIKQAQVLLQEYQEKVQQNFQIILLIGMTGAGKSAIFNFLAGAEFEYIENNEDGDEMKIKEFKNKYSKMHDGLTSLTLAPNYYFCEQYRHLLIDFPGFFDTRGKLIQLLIQMIFNKIVSQTQVKVVYILRHPENTISDRGYGFQESLKQIFKIQKYNISEFTIILNCYSQQLTDQQLKQKFYESELEIFNQGSQNIQVIRKVKDPYTLQQIFSASRRNLLWSSLIQTNSIRFIPTELLDIEELKQYLLKKNKQFIFSRCELIRSQIYNSLNKLGTQTIPTFQRSLVSLIDCLTKDMRLVVFPTWYTQFQAGIKNINSLLQQHASIYTQKNADDVDFIQAINFLQKEFQSYQQIFQIQEQSIHCCQEIIQLLNVHNQKQLEKMENERIQKQLMRKISLEQQKQKNLQTKISSLKYKNKIQEQNQQNLYNKIANIKEKKDNQFDQFERKKEQINKSYKFDYANSYRLQGFESLHTNRYQMRGWEGKDGQLEKGNCIIF